MKIEDWKLRIALAIGCCSIAANAGAQQAPRVAVGVSAGLAELRGGSLVPSGIEPAASARVTARITERLSIDIEGSATARREGREYNRRADWQWREDRRELTAGVYLRARVFTARRASVEPVVGLNRLKPIVRGYQRTYNPFTKQYSEWRRGDPGSIGYSGFYVHETRPAWMLAFGADVAVGSRRLAVVPEFRVLLPFYESAGPTVHTRIGVGMRVGF